MTIYHIFKEAHAGWRYVVFLLLAIALIQSIIALASSGPYSNSNRRVNLFTLISVDIQLLLGIVLYFLSPFVKFDAADRTTDTVRYFTFEHGVMMLIAIALIHIGFSRSKKAATPGAKHKNILIFYFLAILIIIGTIIVGKMPIFGSN